MLLNEKNELHNRTMHIGGAFQFDKKADIREEKADIERQKADIRQKIETCLPALSEKAIIQVRVLFGNIVLDCSD